MCCHAHSPPPPRTCGRPAPDVLSHLVDLAAQSARRCQSLVERGESSAETRGGGSSSSWLSLFVPRQVGAAMPVACGGGEGGCVACMGGEAGCVACKGGEGGSHDSVPYYWSK